MSLTQYEAEFEIAYLVHDTQKMKTIATQAVKIARGSGLQVWHRRLKALEEGKELKFSRARLKEIR